MAFCSNCGNQVEGEFCPECGARVEAENVVVQPEKTGAVPAIDPEVIKKVKKIAIPVAIVAVIAIVVVVLFNTVLNPAKNATNKFLKAIKAGEGEKIVESFHPDYVSFRDDEYADNEYIDYDTYAEYIDESYEMAAEWYADEEDIDLSNIKWEITKIKDVKKGQLKDIQKYFEKTCDIDVKAAKSVKVRIKDDDEKATMELCLIKVGSKWYVAAYDASASDFEALLEQFETQEKMKKNQN